MNMNIWLLPIILHIVFITIGLSITYYITYRVSTDFVLPIKIDPINYFLFKDDIRSLI